MTWKQNKNYFGKLNEPNGIYSANAMRTHAHLCWLIFHRGFMFYKCLICQQWSHNKTLKALSQIVLMSLWICMCLCINIHCQVNSMHNISHFNNKIVSKKYYIFNNQFSQEIILRLFAYISLTAGLGTYFTISIKSSTEIENNNPCTTSVHIWWRRPVYNLKLNLLYLLGWKICL